MGDGQRMGALGHGLQVGFGGRGEQTQEIRFGERLFAQHAAHLAVGHRKQPLLEIGFPPGRRGGMEAHAGFTFHVKIRSAVTRPLQKSPRRRFRP